MAGALNLPIESRGVRERHEAHAVAEARTRVALDSRMLEFGAA